MTQRMFDARSFSMNATGVEVPSRHSKKFTSFLARYKKFTKSAQSSGPENTGPKRMLLGLVAQEPVLSLSRITLENNGKIWPQPDRENSFSRASGGGDGIRTVGWFYSAPQ